MARGPRKHLKRLNAPKHWMLDKLTGVFAPRPSTGPHKLRECLPLCIFLRNRLHYALTMDEVKKILQQRLIKVDGRVRTDTTYPAGFMDVITIEKTNENFRLIYDVKEDLLSTESQLKKQSTNFARSRKYQLARKLFHPWLPMMHELSVILTRMPKFMIQSLSKLLLERSPNPLNSTVVCFVRLLE